MDKYVDLIGSLTSVVEHIATEQYGREITIHCIYNPGGINQTLRIILKKCEQITLHILSDDIQQQGAEIYGLVSEHFEQHLHSTVTTNMFELSAIHRQLDIQWD